MQALLIDRLRHGVSAMPGAAEVLRATATLGLPYRIASNSSHAEMAAKFAVTGLADLVSGRCHSAKDVGIGKPAPDLFLAASAAAGIAPEFCLVVEDSVPGVTAALRAGMDCVAYTPIHSLHDLPPLLAEKMRDQAA
jgi:HAD superfamily hydrolase (TIGR01509 family)